MRNRPVTTALLLAATALAAGCNGSTDRTPPPDTTISAPPTAQYLETSEQTVTKGAESDPNDSEALEAAYSESLLSQTAEVEAQMKEQGMTMKGKDEVLWTKAGEYQDPDIGAPQTTVDACVIRNGRVFNKDGVDITATQKGEPLKEGTKMLIRYTLTTPDDGKTWLIDSWTEKGECTAEQQS